MRIKKYGWAVWDKQEQKFIQDRYRLVFSNKSTAWLVAGKERGRFKVVKIKLQLN